MIKPLLRLLRRKSVLYLILFSSFTYSMLSLFWRPFLRDMSSDYDLDDQVLDIDRVKSKLMLLRKAKLDEDSKNEKFAIEPHFMNDINYDKLSSTELVNVKQSETCRNSVQGKVLIADDKGFVCSRHDLNSGGCCSPSAASTKRYYCETCGPNACCSIYEYCISCCLEPSKKPLLQKILSAGASPSVGVLFASITDHFEFCLTKCRTSSQSVQHENSYRDPRAKHCYGEALPISASQNKNEKEKESKNKKE